MPVGNETSHTMDGLTVRGGLAIVGADGVTSYLAGSGGGEVTSNGQPLAGMAVISGNQAGRTIRENFPRSNGFANQTVINTGVARSTPIALYAGDVINYLTFISGAQAAVAPTNWWFAVYDNQATPTLLAQTADQTSTAWALNTPMTKQLTTTVRIVTTGIYWGTIMVAAGTTPSLYALTVAQSVVAGSLVTGMPVVTQNHGSALTATAPATIATPTTGSIFPYFVASSAA